MKQFVLKKSANEFDEESKKYNAMMTSLMSCLKSYKAMYQKKRVMQL